MIKNILVFIIVAPLVYFGADMVAGGAVPQIPIPTAIPTPLSGEDLSNYLYGNTTPSNELSGLDLNTVPQRTTLDTTRLTDPPRVVVPTAVPVVAPQIPDGSREVFIPYDLTLEKLAGAYENVTVEDLQELNPGVGPLAQGDTVFVPDDAQVRLSRGEEVVREEPTPVPPPDNVDPRLSQEDAPSKASRRTVEEHNARNQRVQPTQPPPKVIDPRVTQKEVTPTPIPPTPVPTTQKTDQERNFQQQYVQPTATATWLYIDPRRTQGED